MSGELPIHHRTGIQNRPVAPEQRRPPSLSQLRAALHQLSTSGGVIHLEKPLDEKIEVELIFHIDRATIRGKAQMLFPMWATQGWMQPFRFTALSSVSRECLEDSLKSFIG